MFRVSRFNKFSVRSLFKHIISVIYIYILFMFILCSWCIKKGIQSRLWLGRGPFGLYIIAWREGVDIFYLLWFWVQVYLYHWLDKTWNLQSFLNWKLKKYLHLWSNEKCVLHSVMFGILTSVHIILSILFDRNIWPSFILVHSYKVSFCVFDFFLRKVQLLEVM